MNMLRVLEGCQDCLRVENLCAKNSQLERIRDLRLGEPSRSCPGIETCVPFCMRRYIERAHHATLRGCTMSNPAGAKLCSSLCRTVSHRCCVKFACPRHPGSGRKAVLGLESKTCVAMLQVFSLGCWHRRPSCSIASAFVHRSSLCRVRGWECRRGRGFKKSKSAPAL